MNSREEQTRKARQLLSDEQLVAFFKAVRNSKEILAVELINKELDDGMSLDRIFYTGELTGYWLSVRRLSGSKFKISFGFDTGLDAGDSEEWKVKFNENQVVLVELGIGSMTMNHAKHETAYPLPPA